MDSKQHSYYIDCKYQLYDHVYSCLYNINLIVVANIRKLVLLFIGFDEDNKHHLWTNEDEMWTKLF